VWSRANDGNDALQGAHQDAQKSTSTTRFSVFGSVSPVSSNSFNRGNGSPTPTCALTKNGLTKNQSTAMSL
jgi:hypothetical protein